MRHPITKDLSGTCFPEWRMLSECPTGRQWNEKYVKKFGKAVDRTPGCLYNLF